jgi:hypothetical protein
VDDEGNPLCLCNDGFLARPGGACEAVTAENCPEHGGDAAEPDDCVARAKTFVPDSSPAPRSIDPAGDYDFFSFSGTAGHVFVATVTRTSGALAPRIDLFDPTGAQLSWAEGVDAAELGVKLPSTAVYAIRVMHSPLDPSVATGEYTFRLQSLGPDDHGDGPETSTLIAADVASGQAAQHAGRFEIDTDADWFRFTASTSQNYRLAFDTSAGGLGVPEVTLWAPGNLDAPRWTALQPAIDFDVPSDGTAHLSFRYVQGGAHYRFTLVRSPK